MTNKRFYKCSHCMDGAVPIACGCQLKHYTPPQEIHENKEFSEEEYTLTENENGIMDRALRNSIRVLNSDNDMIVAIKTLIRDIEYGCMSSDQIQSCESFKKVKGILNSE